MHLSTFCSASALLVAAVSGHMLMKTPTPYGASSLNNSPLLGDGSDFPCKQRSGVYDAQGASNVMPQGSTQTLSFTGSAVHGGGSCQVSITYDQNPTKDSSFKVIHSIEGGCPAKGVAGNLPADPNGNGASQYSFRIPSDLPTGQATLAWTWFNKIGNREMYMNCAPVQITGSGGDRASLGALPDMFRANIGNGCTTADSQDLAFPNPGSSVDKFGSGALAPPVGTCPAGSSSGSASTGGTGGTGSGAAPAAASSAVASPAASASAATGGAGAAGGVFATTSAAASSTVASSPTSTSAAAAAPAVATPASSAAASPAASPAAGAGTSTTTVGAQTGSCKPEGAFACLSGGKSFQQCASGSWSVVQQMAAGTSCMPQAAGSIKLVTRSVPSPLAGGTDAVLGSGHDGSLPRDGDGADGASVSAHKKRHIRFSHGHLQRLQGSSL